jgi:hypothetical protein
MAVLHKKLIGTPQGTSGDLVFRIKQGVTYLCARPIPFIPGSQPADIARRKKFALACRFSARVNQIPKLKELWERFEGKASSFNLIAKANYNRVLGEVMGDNATITPQKGLQLTVTSAALTGTGIQVEIDSLETGQITPAETRVRLISLIHLSSPTDPTNDAHDFIPVVSPAQAADFTVPTIFTVALDPQDTLLYGLYATRKLFYAIVTEDADGKLYSYSRTYSE